MSRRKGIQTNENRGLRRSRRRRIGIARWTGSLLAVALTALVLYPAAASAAPSTDESISVQDTSETGGTTATSFSVRRVVPVQRSKAWVDATGDGRADYCRLVGSYRLRCAPSSGAGFGTEFTSVNIDPGYSKGRAWADVNADGKADYCRVVGGWNKQVACTPSNGSSFASTITSAPLDAGYDAGRAWVDVTGDGRADYCRVVGGWYKQVACTPSTGTGFATDKTFSSDVLDPGYDATRTWADVNGDGRADYCAVIDSFGKRLSCTASTGTGFARPSTSSVIDEGWEAGRAWADATGDGKADYCRVVGYYAARCAVSPTGQPTYEFQSGGIDPGYDAGRGWADVTGDGRADYCRVVGGWYKNVSCTPSSGSGFSVTFTSGNLDPGHDTSRAWADVTGDGRADYCRVVEQYRLRCTTSAGSSFGTDVAQPWWVSIDPGHDD